MSDNNRKTERVSPYVKELSKMTGKNEREIEKLWNKAKELAVDTYGIDEKDFKEKHYQFILETVKEMLGLNENKSLVVEFVQSDKSAKEFIQETVIANDFSALWKGHIKPKEKDDTKMDVGDEIDKAIKQQTEAQKDGTPPDGTGPHGKGDGPGKGKADGTGMKKDKDDEEDDDEEEQKKKESIKYTIEQLKEMPIKEIYEMEDGITMEIELPNGQQRFVKAQSREEAQKDGWKIEE